MLDFHLYLSTKYTSVFVRQAVLGSVAGVRREAANIKSRQLHEMNLVQKVYNEWTSCNYKINPLFYVYADELKHIFPALKIICRKRLLSAFLCASFANRTPILEEEDYFNNPSITIAKIDSQSWKIDNNINIEEQNPSMGGVDTMEPSKIIISPVMQRITDALKLTIAGQYKLMVFPDAALSATFDEYKRKSHLKDPYFWFVMYAKGYCIQNNLHVDWDMWPLLCKKYNIADNAPFIQPPTSRKIIPVIIPEIASDRKVESEKYKQAVLEGKPHPAWAHYALPGTID